MIKLKNNNDLFRDGEEIGSIYKSRDKAYVDIRMDCMVELNVQEMISIMKKMIDLECEA